MSVHESATASEARSRAHEERAGSRAVRWAVVAFVAGIVIATSVMLLRGGDRLPLGGGDSVGNLAAWLAGASASIAYAAAFLLEARRGYDRWRRGLPAVKRVVDVIAMMIAMLMLSYFVVMAVASLFQLGFRGMTVDPLGGGVLAGAAAAALAYLSVHFGSRVRAEGLAMVATLVLFLGTMASMLSTPDELWWQLHFSQLGNVGGLSGSRFNLSLIVTGLVLTVLANYVGHLIRNGMLARGADPGRRGSLFSWLFAGIGICLTVAGLVTDAMNFTVHVGAASGMVVLFGVFVLCALRMIPDLPREVSLFSLVVVVGILVAIVLWVPVGYYNLTGMEFIAAALLFAWLTVFVRAVEVYGGDVGDE